MVVWWPWKQTNNRRNGYYFTYFLGKFRGARVTSFHSRCLIFIRRNATKTHFPLNFYAPSQYWVCALVADALKPRYKMTIKPAIQLMKATSKKKKIRKFYCCANDGIRHSISNVDQLFRIAMANTPTSPFIEIIIIGRRYFSIRVSRVLVNSRLMRTKNG